MAQNINIRDPYGLLDSGIPPEIAARLMSAGSRKDIADAMLANSMRPVENKEGPGAKVSWTQGLAQIADALLGGKMTADYEKTYADIASQADAGKKASMEQFSQLQRGTPAVPYNDTLGSEAPQGNITEGRPGNMQAALEFASTDPYLKKNAVVASMMKAWEKAQEPFTLPQGAKRFVGTTAVAENAPKPTEHVIDGKVYRSEGSGLKEVGGPGKPVDYNKPFLPDGTPNLAYQGYELEKANRGATRVQTQVNSYTPASEEAQKKFIDSTRTTYDALKQAPVALDSIEKAKSLIPEASAFMGPGGSGMLDAAKFLNNRLGMNINTEGIKSAEELRTRIFFNIMDNLKKMDAQPSQMQQQIMMDALGNLGTDPNALPSVLDAFADVIRGKVSMHNNEVAGAIERGVKFPYDPIVKVPPKGAGAGAPKRISSEQEYNALQSGEKYIGPDGQVRTKR